MSEPDWETVVRRIKAGNPSGSDELYRLLNSGLRLLIVRSLGPQDVDDHVHETLLIVIEAIRNGQLQNPKRLLGFVRAGARNLIAETMADRVCQRDHSVAEASMKPMPEGQALDQQHIALMQRVLGALSPRDREVLARYYVRGQSQEQILADMHITAAQFQSCRSEAKARFARLGQMGVGPARPLHGIRLHLTHAHR